MSASSFPSKMKINQSSSSKHYEELSRVLLTECQLQERVRDLALRITEDYRGEELVVVGLLKGAVMFTADLAREISLPLVMDWMAISTYGSGTVAGQPRLLKDLSVSLHGRNVLIVEDILDTGVTLDWLTKRLETLSPRSLHCCVLLRKPYAITKPIVPRYVGFDITTEWVAGYGIDYAERYRNLRQIYEVQLLPTKWSQAAPTA
jgi:hypoxanthine phosphoribosyltransferase